MCKLQDHLSFDIQYLNQWTDAIAALNYPSLVRSVIKTDDGVEIYYLLTQMQKANLFKHKTTWGEKESTDNRRRSKRRLKKQNWGEEMMVRWCFLLKCLKGVLFRGNVVSLRKETQSWEKMELQVSWNSKVCSSTTQVMLGSRCRGLKWTCWRWGPPAAFVSSDHLVYHAP